MDYNRIYTFSDLELWGTPGTHLAVIGNPIIHSISPLLHNAGFRHLVKEDERFNDWHYHKFNIQPNELSQALKLFHEKGFRGLNITAPLKLSAFQLTKEIDHLARPYNAINTLVFQYEGYKGYNTDITGIDNSILKTFGITFKGLDVIVIGAGGIATTAAMHAISKGCNKLFIGNRNPEKLDILVSRLKNYSNSANITIFDPSNPPTKHLQDALLINGTPLGLKDEDALPMSLDGLGSELRVFDMTYAKKDSALIKEAKKRKMATCNGLTMLVEQALKPFMLWTNHEIDARIMYDVILKYDLTQ